MKTLLLTVSSFTSISFCFIVFVFFLFLFSKIFWNNYSSVPNCRESQITHFVKKPSNSFKILVIFYRPLTPLSLPTLPLLRLPPKLGTEEWMHCEIINCYFSIFFVEIQLEKGTQKALFGRPTWYTSLPYNLNSHWPRN